MDNYRSVAYSHYKAMEGQHLFVDQAVAFVVGILDLFNFDNDQLYLTFNGGKDATVVLYLTVIAMEQIKLKSKIKCIYFEEPEPFPEADDFIKSQVESLGLEMFSIQSDKKVGLQELKNKTQIKAVLMGTRSTDPYSDKLEKITLTDKGYATMLRLNPILYWTFEQVWIFLKEYQIPYCKLYSQGYTYLGNQKNTVPNPYLKIGENSYKPAWEADGIQELFSRMLKPEVSNGKQNDCKK